MSPSPPRGWQRLAIVCLVLRGDHLTGVITVLHLMPIRESPQFGAWATLNGDGPLLPELEGWFRDDLLSAEEMYNYVGSRTGTPGEALGIGFAGVAYRLPEGKVLKLTNDASEVMAMGILRGENHPNIIGVYDAFILHKRNMQRLERYNFGVVVRDFVDELVSDHREWTALSRHLLVAGLAANEVFIKKGDMSRGVDKFLRLMKKGIEKLYGQENDVAHDVISGVERLRTLGIYTFDFGPKNVGIQDGRGVLFDIGSASIDPDVKTALDFVVFGSQDETPYVNALMQDFGVPREV